MYSSQRHESFRRARETSDPAAPPISSISPPCQRCGHSGVVHSDGADRQCLYAECSCVVAREERRGGDVVSLVARRDGARVTATLRRKDAEERAERLRRLGWEIQLEREA